ncbi:MAG TPA: peptidoglycan-associated lipoprotein Pal, partial [Stellaceae bacterium]|nr:peptidoglycan-associated lipoprotein Pal [Stellaceae bacterium]
NLRPSSLLAGLLLLAACSQNPSTNANAGGGATAAPSSTSSVVPGSSQDFVQNVGDRVFFDFDKSVIKPEGQQTLQRQAQWLQKYQNVTVTIEGHCDDRGTREYNLALGERRATAVKNALVALGVSANRIKTISYGKERPIVLGDNEAAWAQNRVGITVIN